MTFSRLVLSGAFLAAMTGPAAWGPRAQAAHMECAGEAVCRDHATSMPLRVVPLVSQQIRTRPDATGPVTTRVTAFRPLYVFERIGITPGQSQAHGWYRVGAQIDRPIGYVRAQDVAEWRLPLVARYSERNAASPHRSPVTYFSELAAAEEAMDQTASGHLPVSSRRAGAIARERSDHPQARKSFYLLPVLQHIDVEAYGIENGLLLQIALPTRRDVVPTAVLCSVTRTDCAPHLPHGLARFFAVPRKHSQSMLAWTMDFDPAHRHRKLLDLHVLLTRTNLESLGQGLLRLQALIEMARLDAWLERGGRRVTGPGAALPHETDKHVEPSAKDGAFAESLPAWVAAMPYRSDLTGLTLARFGTLDVHDQARIEKRLSDAARHVRLALADPRRWVDLADTMGGSPEQEHVIAVPLANLP